MKIPRELILLRVDDKLPATKPPVSSGISLLGYEPPPGIKLVSFKHGESEYLGIDGWERSIRYWLSFSTDKLPDLIVADVRFDKDLSSPLNYDSQHTCIPTGISHLKPIAGVARGLGRPLGIALHTDDVNQWKNLARQNDLMGYLAAHEIGELAAILGDIVPLDNLPAKEQRMEWCWYWLSNNVKTDFELALKIALRNFRQHLIRAANSLASARHNEISVLPQEYIKLLNWCNQNAADKLTPIDDIGIGYIKDDGTFDRISFRSLFADSSTELDALPTSCFEIPDERRESLFELRPWELTIPGLPKIGGFITALGTLAEVCKEASDQVKKFPVFLSQDADSTRLVTIIESPLVRGFVVLFQLLRKDHYNFKSWEEYFSKPGWDHINCCNKESSNSSLKRYLKTINMHLRSAIEEDPWVYSDDLTEEFEISKKSIQLHLELLISARVVDQKYDNAGQFVYRSISDTINQVPVPDSPPKDLNLIGTSLKSYLRDTLGVPENDYNQIGLAMNAAFVNECGNLNERAKAGRHFLNSFLEGNSPSWLIEICRDYARRGLQWENSGSWPQSIRETDQSPTFDD